jgi:hypothetical protein
MCGKLLEIDASSKDCFIHSVEDIKRDIKLESRKNYPFSKNNEQKENLNIKGSRGLAT